METDRSSTFVSYFDGLHIFDLIPLTFASQRLKPELFKISFSLPWWIRFVTYNYLNKIQNKKELFFILTEEIASLSIRQRKKLRLLFFLLKKKSELKLVEVFVECPLLYVIFL